MVSLTKKKMIYIVTIFIVTMQVVSYFLNITNNEKKKMCWACVSFKKIILGYILIMFKIEQNCHNLR